MTMTATIKKITFLATILALVTTMTSNSQAGHFGHYRGEVYANSSVQKQYYFSEGDFQEIILIASDSDVDLWIRDRNGKLIAKSVGLSGSEHVGFNVPYDDVYTVVIENEKKPTSSRFKLILK